MRYYVKYDENEKLLCFGIGCGGTEITEDEYHTLQDHTNRTWVATTAVVSGEITIESVDEDIRDNVQREAVAQLAEQVYDGEPIDTVPGSLQADVQSAVNALIAERGEPDEQDISDSEALDIIMGVSV